MTFATVMATKSPSAWYRHGEPSGTTLVDASGNARDGTYTSTGTALGTTGLLTGDADTCVDFDGTDGFATIADAAWMDGTSLSLFTIINADSVASTPILIERDLSTGGGNRTWEFRLNAGKLEFFFWDTGGTLRGPYQSTSTLSTATTYDVGVSYDHSTVRFYVNGAADGTHAISTSGIRSTTMAIQIARHTSPSSALLFNGRMDETALLVGSGTVWSGTDYSDLHDARLGVVGTADLSVAATMPLPTLAVALSVTSADLTVAATMPSPTLAVALSVAPPTWALRVAADSPLAWWRQDDTAGTTMADSSGNARHGTYSGSPTFSQASLVQTDANLAVAYDGTNDYAEVADAAWMDVSALTVYAVVKFDSGVSDSLAIVSRWSSTSGQNVWYLYRAFSGEATFVWSDSDDVLRTLTGNATIALDTVCHVAATVDSAGVGRLYINGVLDNTLDPSGSVGIRSSSSAPIQVGARSFGGAGLFFDGVLDEVVVYGTALSDARIAGLYEIAVVNSVTVAATMPLPTLAVALSAEFAADLSVAGTMPLPVLAVSLDAELLSTDLSVAATMPLPVLAVALEAEVVGSTLAVAATMPLPTLAVTLSAAVVYSTDTSNDDDGIYLGDGLAEVDWEPDVVPVPAHLALGQHRTVAHAVTTPPGIGQAFTPAVHEQASIDGLRERVLIDGEDFTFYNDAPATVDNLRLIDPLLYGSGQVTIHGINPQFPDAGLGDLRDRFRHARVRIQLVDAADVVQVADYYKGFVAKVDTSGTQLVLGLGGQASGRLAGMRVPPTVYRRKQDVEHICVDLLRDARLRAKKHDGLSGLGLIRRGGTNGLDIFNETVAVWAGATGSAVTFTPNDDGVYRKTTKNTTTIDATAYIDSSLITQSLSQDFMEEFTRVYARGFTAAGELVTNIKTPGLTQGDAPTFPHATLIQSPMTDADTTSGAGVTAIQEQLAIHNYYDVEDGTPGEYDEAVEDAVEQFQYDAGLLVAATAAGQAGAVNADTWDALWDLARIGYSLDDAREYPMAQDIASFKWFRTANGSKIRENLDYDPHLIPNDIDIEVGGPFPRRRIREFAESKLVPDGGVWLGTLTFKSGLISGEHTPGGALVEADVMDRRDLLPNMRVKLPWFAGGIVVYVNYVEHGPDETQAAVSSVPMSTMEVWNAIERRREAMANRVRAAAGHLRASQVRDDGPPQWDTRGGRIANKVALTAGWNEIPVPVGAAGVVQRVRIQLEDAAEFACLLTQKQTAVDLLDARIPTPLTDPRPTRPWFEQESIVDWLDGRGKLDAWGTEANPCGYDPSLKTDDLGDTAQAMTGLFVENAGFNYVTGSEPVLYLYVWVGSANALMPGRVLRKQDTPDF